MSHRPFHTFVAVCTLLGALLAATGCGKSPKAQQPFKLTTQLKIKVDGQDLDGETTVLFFDHRAALWFERDISEEPDTVFDLAAMTWRDADDDRTVTLAECEQWAQKFLKGAEEEIRKNADPETLAFVKSLVKPELKLTEGEDKITLRNDHVEYSVTPHLGVSRGDRELILKFIVINGYHDGMLEHKVPPFAILSLVEVLEAREWTPETISASVHGPKGVSAQVNSTHLRQDLSAEELKRVEELAESWD